MTAFNTEPSSQQKRPAPERSDLPNTEPLAVQTVIPPGLCSSVRRVSLLIALLQRYRIQTA